MYFIKKILHIAPCLFLSALSHDLSAQRLTDNNTIGWYSMQATVHTSKRTSLWLDYQYRRDDIITNWQQSLARAGFQYHMKRGVSAMLGYAYIITYPYGDFPAGPHHVPEQRIFEQLMWVDTIGRISLNHRLRLEQRFLGKVNQAAVENDVLEWIYANRIRYQMRASMSLHRKAARKKNWYAAVYDELFIGFGKNVNQNVFDQNRIGLLLGYQFNKSFRVEGGYLSQIVQQSALRGGQQVYQYNNGLLVNVLLQKNRVK